MITSSHFDLVPRNDKKNYFIFRLDDIPYHSGGGVNLDDDGRPKDIWANDPEIATAIIESSFEQLERPEFMSLNNFKRIDDISVTFFTSANYDETSGENGERINIANGAFRASIFAEPNLSLWNKPFSYDDYQRALKIAYESLLDKTYELVFYNRDEHKTCLEAEFLNQANAPLKTLVEQMWKTFRRLHAHAYESLLDPKSEDPLAFRFDFPEEVRTACTQYLLYFAQFLRDIGLEASTDLRFQLGEVLFSITPSDGEVALDKIREALSIYLHLPSSPLAFDESFMAMRLQQQIENLQHSQTIAQREHKLAQRLLESQDALISQKNIIIDQQSRVIEAISSKSVMIDSAKDKEELENLYEGLKVGESEILKKWTGLRLNPVTALKSIGKNILGKTETLSVVPDDCE